MSREYPDRPVVGVGAVVWRGKRVLLIRRAGAASRWAMVASGRCSAVGRNVARGGDARGARGNRSAARERPILTTVDLADRQPDGRVRYHYTWWTSSPRRPMGRRSPATTRLRLAYGGRAGRSRPVERDPSHRRRSCRAAGRPRRVPTHWACLRRWRAPGEIAKASWCLRLPMRRSCGRVRATCAAAASVRWPWYGRAARVRHPRRSS